MFSLDPHLTKLNPSNHATGAVVPSSPGTPFVSTQDVKGLGLIPLACFRNFAHRCALSEIPALDDKRFPFKCHHIYKEICKINGTLTNGPTKL